MRRKRGLLAPSAVALLTICCWLVPASPASASHECGGQTPCSFSNLRGYCIVSENPYSGEPMITAQVKVVMRNAARSSNYIHAYVIKARLVPVGSGIKSGFAENKDDSVKYRASLSNVRNMTVTTGTEVAEGDWNLEVKLIWDRSRGKPDWHVDRVLSFNENFCQE